MYYAINVTIMHEPLQNNAGRDGPRTRFHSLVGPDGLRGEFQFVLHRS